MIVFFMRVENLFSKLCSVVDQEIFISLNRSQEPKKILFFFVLIFQIVFIASNHQTHTNETI